MATLDKLGTLFDYLLTLGVAGSREREYYFSIEEDGKLRKMQLHGMCVPCKGPVEIRLLDLCENEGRQKEEP